MGRYKHRRDKHSGRLRPEHVVIWENETGKKLPDGYIIHHIDGNSKNNDISNLQPMTRAEHNSLHATLRREGKDPVNPDDPDVIADRQKSRETWKRTYPSRKESEVARLREFRRRYPEKGLAYAKQYQLTHKDAIAVARRKHYLANKKRINEESRAYRNAHRDEAIAYSRAYYAKNKQLLLAKDRLRRAIKTGMSQDEIAHRQSVVDSLSQEKLKQEKKQ